MTSESQLHLFSHASQGSSPSNGAMDTVARYEATSAAEVQNFTERYLLSSQTERRSFGFARYIGWITLIALVVLSVFLSSYFGKTARDSLLNKQEAFAELLSDYLNNQIYRRFTMPTVTFFGRITLSKPEQYKALEQVILSITSGLQVEQLRIYAHDNTVTYSTVEGEPGTTRISKSVQKAATSDSPIFDIDADFPYWQAFFHFPLEEGSFKLRTTMPLRPENRLGSSEAEGPLMGVLEFTQDITGDMERAIRYQQLILIVTSFCSILLFCLLLFFIRRAERALALRMEKENTLVRDLHQSEKLAGMGRMVAGIAHEIRNPLGIISSSAELLIKRSKKEDTANTRILQAIYDEAKRLSSTLNDFLDYARPRIPQMLPVDVSGVITQVLNFLEHDTVNRDIAVLRTGFADTPIFVQGDRDLLYRAFYNILSNSFAAMGSKGIMSIDCLKLKTSTPVIVINFRDTGPGFPEDAMTQLLDPFFTTKEDGTGLGLPIVSSIILSHGGKLDLRNWAEDGTTGGAEISVTLQAVL